MKVVISHPTSHTFNRAAVMALYNANMLSEFDTAVAVFPDSILDKLGSISILSDIRRRSFSKELKSSTYSWPWLEIGRMVASKAGLTSLTKHEKGVFSVDAVYQGTDKKVAKRLPNLIKQGANAIFAYEDGAIFSFREAKRLGLPCFYDLPIGYWRAARRLLELERERWPDWAETLTGLTDSDEKLARKDEEIRLADRIFVASQFTAKTLQDYPDSLPPVDIIPYAFPEVTSGRTYIPFSNARPLKLLFVGGLSQRKGIADLVAAVDAIGPRVELTIVGRKASENCAALNEALTRYRWLPSLPHEEILKLMREHDVLVFPSLFEGFGLVITEAMSQGTPVITTDRTAGPDFIQHGENGWLIEAGSTQALQAAIEDLLHNPSTVAENGKAAMETAKKRSWEAYGKEIVDAISRH